MNEMLSEIGKGVGFGQRPAEFPYQMCFVETCRTFKGKYRTTILEAFKFTAI